MTVRAAELLEASATGAIAPILVQSKSCIANDVTSGDGVSTFGPTRIDGDDAIATVSIMDRVVNALGIVAFIGDEGAASQRDGMIGCMKNIKGDSTIGNIGYGCKFKERQAGDAIDKDRVLLMAIYNTLGR